MRVFRQTIILLVAFLVILGVYFLVIKPSEEKKKQKEEQEKKIVNVDSSKINEIWITKQNGEKIGLKRVNSKWDIIHPIWAEADKFSVNPIASRYSSIEIERVIEKNVVDEEKLKEFGFIPPRFKVELKVKDEKEEEKRIVILIGEKSKVGYSIYAKREDDPENKIVLISASLEAVIDKNLQDFREKKPMDFVVPDVKKLVIVKNGKQEEGSSKKEYIFEKREGGDWYIKFPENTTYVKARESQVRDLLYSINGIKIAEFVSDSTQPQNLYGLENPDISIEAIMSDEEKYNLLLKIQHGKIYAKKPDRPNIFSVEIQKDFYNTLFASLYRERKILGFYVWRVKEVSIEREQKITIIQRDPVNTDKFYLVYGNEKKELDSSQVKDLLSQLSNVEVVDFVEDDTDITKFVKAPKIRVRVDVDGKVTPYSIVLGDKTEKGIIGAEESEKSVYIFPTGITEIISKIENLKPQEKVEEK
jgi:hypothetical protein